MATGIMNNAYSSVFKVSVCQASRRTSIYLPLIHTGRQGLEYGRLGDKMTSAATTKGLA